MIKSPNSLFKFHLLFYFFLWFLCSSWITDFLAGLGRAAFHYGVYSHLEPSKSIILKFKKFVNYEKNISLQCRDHQNDYSILGHAFSDASHCSLHFWIILTTSVRLLMLFCQRPISTAVLWDRRLTIQLITFVLLSLKISLTLSKFSISMAHRWAYWCVLVQSAFLTPAHSVIQLSLI